MINLPNIKGSSFIGWLLLLLMMALRPAVAMTLEGDYVQGGMLIGQVEPGSQVSVNGQSVKVSRTGEFLVGF
ncbi:MAG: hypothetical protein AB2699_09675, partial [Candidatus Thiodiazotropha taylori]